MSVVLWQCLLGVAYCSHLLEFMGVMSYLSFNGRTRLSAHGARRAKRADVLALLLASAETCRIGTANRACFAPFRRGSVALLMGVGRIRLATFVLVTFVLAATRCWQLYPRLRASRADPMIALGHTG